MRFVFVLIVSLGSLSACVHHHPPVAHRGPVGSGPVIHGPVLAGPPPHAPAHGHRQKHGKVDLQFDTGVGVYLVLGHPGYYFWQDHYWWFHDGLWRRSTVWGGSYLVIDHAHHVPPGLYKKHPHGKTKAKDKGNSKGKGKDKD